jgi:pyruvate-formate lyase-activating enzyme
MRGLWNYINRGRLWRVYGRSVIKYGTARKVLNAVRTEWAYRSRKVDVRTPPYVLFIEPLYYCNLKCPLCPRELQPNARKKPSEAGKLPLEFIDQIFEELGPYLFQCHIFGNGEPMLDWPRTKHLVQAARRHRVFTLISTNCTTITPKMADDIVTSGLDYLVCAIDGTSQASYEKYRVGGQYEKAFEGMRLICEAAKRHRSPIALEWQYLVSAFTYPEMDRARQLARELGIYLRFSPLGGLGDPDSQRYWGAPDPAWSVQHTGSFDHNFACYWLWRALVINSNGQLGRCPGFSNIAQIGSIDPKVTRRGVLDGVMSIYNGPTSQRARQLFVKAASGEEPYPEPCTSCSCFARHHGLPLGAAQETPRITVTIPLKQLAASATKHAEDMDSSMVKI